MAGMTLRWARSPVAPKSTKAHGSGSRPTRRPRRSGLPAGSERRRRVVAVASRSCRAVRGRAWVAGRAGLMSLRLDCVAAELVPERRQDLGLVAVVLAGAEAGEQGHGDHG